LPKGRKIQIRTQGGEAAKSLRTEIDIDNGAFHDLSAYCVFDLVNTYVSQPPIDQVIRVTRAPHPIESSPASPPPSTTQRRKCRDGYPRGRRPENQPKPRKRKPKKKEKKKCFLSAGVVRRNGTSRTVCRASMRTDIQVCHGSISVPCSNSGLRDDMYANHHHALSLHSHGGLLPIRIRHRPRRRYGRTTTKARG
jgi:hypothetical protein